MDRGNSSAVLLVLTTACALGMLTNAAAGTKAAATDDTAAASAFQRMTKVLRNPRCMNCHSNGDFPRQGDDRHRHTMNVRRGPDGHGVSAVKCESCHMDGNVVGAHRPPGAPGWHLPSPEMPMIWEGLNDKQLCEILKDPKQNGGRNLEQIVEHLQTPLVLWGWHPGEGRSAIDVPQSEFLASAKEWAANGGACPSTLRSSVPRARVAQAR